jgi:hypothetical protein
MYDMEGQRFQYASRNISINARRRGFYGDMDWRIYVFGFPVAGFGGRTIRLTYATIAGGK